MILIRRGSFGYRGLERGGVAFLGKSELQSLSRGRLGTQRFALEDVTVAPARPGDEAQIAENSNHDAGRAGKPAFAVEPELQRENSKAIGYAH